MAFTEFLCNASTGSNINAGDGAATVSTTANGAYTRGGGAGGTDLFVATGGTPFSTAIAGDWVSVYNDGATTTTFIGRITAVNSGGLSVDISLTAIAGTRPTTAATGKTATIGGAWKGPNGASGFPFGFMAATAKNVAGNPPRVNFKNNATYDITAAMSTTNAGPIFWQGYGATPGDLDGSNSKAIIQGTTVGASHVLLNVTSANNQFSDFIFNNSAATSGSSDGIIITAAENYFNRCAVHNIRRTGITSSTGIQAYMEVELYACNKSNASSETGIYCLLSGTAAIRVISHHHGTAGQTNCNGMKVDGGVVVFRCISESNQGNGSFSTGDVTQTQYGNEYYNNGLSGLLLANSAHMLFNMQNCNFLKNGRYAVENSNVFDYNGVRYNCGFGTGTEANTLGDIEDMEGMEISGTVTYASNVNPWTDPANGDFRLSLAAAIGTGRGLFTETATSYTGSVSLNSIGAAVPTSA